MATAAFAGKTLVVWVINGWRWCCCLCGKVQSRSKVQTSLLGVRQIPIIAPAPDPPPFFSSHSLCSYSWPGTVSACLQDYRLVYQYVLLLSIARITDRMVGSSDYELNGLQSLVPWKFID